MHKNDPRILYDAVRNPGVLLLTLPAKWCNCNYQRVIPQLGQINRVCLLVPSVKGVTIHAKDNRYVYFLAQPGAYEFTASVK